MAAFRSFADQGIRYYNRPHKSVPAGPVTNAAAWKGSDLRHNQAAWHYQLTQSDISEIQQAVTTIQESQVDLTAVDRDNFRLPVLSKTIREWCQDIMEGNGIKYVTGLPVDSMTEEQIRIAFWGIGHHLGLPGAQNPDNELLGHVKDYGESADDPFVRLYRTSSNIRFHCDASDIVGLFCLHPAKEGGQSRIVSTVRLFNELIAEHPELAPRLFEVFRMDRRGEVAEGQKPYSHITPARFADGTLRTFYHSDYFRSVERHEGIELTDEERKILDFYDETAANPDIHLDMWLNRGDMQFVSNHTIAHARTEYLDFDEPGKKRHLLRLWLSAE